MDIDIFKFSYKQAKRQLRSRIWFSDRNLATLEIDDPVAPGKPFFSIGAMAQFEAEYGIKRDRVPEYLQLFVGANARQRLIKLLREVYDLDIQERIATFEKVSPPINDDPNYVCLIEHPERNPVFFGHRLTAIVSPLFRPMFFMDGPRVFHGESAINRMRQLFLSDTDK